MRKFCFVLVAVLFIVHYGNAQEVAPPKKDTIRLKQIAREEGQIVTDRPPQAVYFQLGGSSPILGVHYDRRFNKTLNGPGFAVGLGYWFQNDDFFGDISMFSIPVSLNYLIGRKTHFVEVAAGTTFVTARSSDLFDESESGSGFIHHINLGYRHQPATGGFFFRGGVSPLFSSGESFISYYLGFGHNF